MANTLEVQIIGDVSSLDKALKQAEKLQAEYSKSIEQTSRDLAETITISRQYSKAVDELTKSYKDGSISSKEYSTQLAKIKKDEQETGVATANLRKELSNLKREQKELGNSFDAGAKKTANGGNALMQFSRIAQDAPFGIIGIGNNITATVESFGHLQRSTGGAGAALKAMGASLIGGGGILLAISLVTTGLTVMAQKGLTVGDVFDKLTGSFDENANAIKKASIEGAKSASEEIINLNALVSVAQNETLAKKDRLIAVEKLQQQYPAYFGNLSNEAILTGDVAKVTQELTRALVSKAIAEKLASDSAEVQLKIFEANAKLINAKNKTSQLEIKLEEDLAEAKKINGISEAQLATIRAKGINAINASKDAEEESRAEIIKGTEALKQRQDIINKFAGQGIKTSAPAIAKTKKPKAEKVFDTPQVEGVDNQIQAQDLVDTKSIAVVTGKLDEFKNKIKDVAKIEVSPIKPRIKISSEELDAFEKKMKQAKANAKIFSDAIGSSVDVLADQMTTSLQTGNAVLDAFTGSVIKSLAQIAQAQIAGLIADQAIATAKIGTNQAVATSSAVAAGSQTAAASGPAAAFLLPALVGAAIGFVAASFAGIKFAHGGVVPGGSFTGDKVPAMLNSGETVMNQQQQANTLMAIANGNSNALQGNRSIDQFSLSTLLRGSDILLSIDRQQRKR